MDLNDRDDSLIEKVNQHPLAGNDYFACIECGRCVGSCPAAKVSERFNIREFNRRIKKGDISLLDEEAIWDCFYCRTCVKLCPKDNIDGYKTIIILRDLALSQGKGIEHMKRVIPVIKQYIEKGVLTEGDTWLTPEALEEVRLINENTGLTAHVKGLENKLEAENGNGEGND